MLKRNLSTIIVLVVTALLIILIVIVSNDRIKKIEADTTQKANH
ncbi:MAG TPA: hypothetical protein VF476_03440 [Chitinophagaceae bacterium]